MNRWTATISLTRFSIVPDCSRLFPIVPAILPASSDSLFVTLPYCSILCCCFALLPDFVGLIARFCYFALLPDFVILPLLSLYLVARLVHPNKSLLFVFNPVCLPSTGFQLEIFKPIKSDFSAPEWFLSSSNVNLWSALFVIRCLVATYRNLPLIAISSSSTSRQDLQFVVSKHWISNFGLQSP